MTENTCNGETEKTWIDTLVIKEEPSKDKNGKPSTIFYIREKPFLPGFSYQSTALNENAAKWVIAELRRTEKELEPKRKLDALIQETRAIIAKFQKNNWWKRSLAWRFNRMHREPIIGMDLVYGLTDKDMQKLRPLQTKRLCIMAAGRATQYQAKEKYNAAHHWLKIAGTLYRKMSASIQRTKTN